LNTTRILLRTVLNWVLCQQQRGKYRYRTFRKISAFQSVAVKFAVDVASHHFAAVI
jgi:hypothetical protein